MAPKEESGGERTKEQIFQSKPVQDKELWTSINNTKRQMKKPKAQVTHINP
ncbi:UNVERIFIED_CONTAM: hypothetical protein FKN15_053285 [Acipenser sinensis]